MTLFGTHVFSRCECKRSILVFIPQGGCSVLERTSMPPSRHGVLAVDCVSLALLEISTPEKRA